MARTVILALVFVAVGVAMWWLAAWPARDEGVAVEFRSADQPGPPLAAAPEPPAESAQREPPAEPEAPAEPDEAVPAADLDPQAAGADLFAHPQGPVAELRRQYESEPRESSAHVLESTIRNAFNPPDGPPGLLGSVLCRRTVCKLEVRMSAERLGDYIAAITRVSADFEREVAAEPREPGPTAGVRTVDVYLKRLPPSAERVPLSAE